MPKNPIPTNHYGLMNERIMVVVDRETLCVDSALIELHREAVADSSRHRYFVKVCSLQTALSISDQLICNIYFVLSQFFYKPDTEGANLWEYEITDCTGSDGRCYLDDLERSRQALIPVDWDKGHFKVQY